MRLFKQIYWRLRDLFYRNRWHIEAGNSVVVSDSARSALKKTTIKVRGKGNRLIIGDGANITNCEIRLYGKNNVILEENYVAVKVILPKKLYFYEVKSSSYASDCIREALGQILSYYHNDSDRREKYLFVAGQYEPNDDELGFIQFIKDTLNVKFDYISIALNE